MVLKLWCVSELFGDLLKQIARPGPQVSDSVGLEVGLGICISNKSPSDADAVCSGTAFWETSV